MEEYPNQVSHELPPAPNDSQKILVTGATGYIGGQLVPELLVRGYHVRVMVRSISTDIQARWPGAEFVLADALVYSELSAALNGIDCAYYFIHSLYLGKNKFKEVDDQAAINFCKAAEENNLKRIIYLGSLGDPEASLSDHLRSRLSVAEQLGKGKTPVTILKAAVIIGNGSASYKIIKYLVQECPFFLFPRWANSYCQPIAIRDVLRYLIGCLQTDATIGQTYDIGGSTVISYQDMLKTQATLVGKKPLFCLTFFSSLNIYARIASFYTPIKYQLIKSLMESCANDVVCKNNEIRDVVPFDPLTYQEALALTHGAFIRNQNMVPSRDKSKLIKSQPLAPPTSSKWPLSDVLRYVWHRPEKSTHVKSDSRSEREDYSYRILQRLSVAVTDYQILNIHKIGVNVPAKYVFEELLNWNGDSTCWPNNIAKVTKVHDELEHIDIHLFGWAKYPVWLRWLFGENITPLFKLDAINFQIIPDDTSADNARFLLYKCSGGYPIGIFSMYVRSSIIEEEEEELSQLFIMVGFNFFGKKKWSKTNIIYRIWELIHNRVTSNVLNRIKRLSEWRFEKISAG